MRGEAAAATKPKRRCGPVRSGSGGSAGDVAEHRRSGRPSSPRRQATGRSSSQSGCLASSARHASGDRRCILRPSTSAGRLAAGRRRAGPPARPAPARRGPRAETPGAATPRVARAMAQSGAAPRQARSDRSAPPSRGRPAFDAAQHHCRRGPAPADMQRGQTVPLGRREPQAIGERADPRSAAPRDAAAGRPVRPPRPVAPGVPDRPLRATPHEHAELRHQRIAARGSGAARSASSLHTRSADRPARPGTAARIAPGVPDPRGRRHSARRSGSSAGCADNPRRCASPGRRRNAAAGVQVGDAVEVVEHRAVTRHRHCVDGEVAPRRVRPPVVGEGDHGMPAVGLDVAAQGGDLEAPSSGDRRHRAVVEPGRHGADARCVQRRVPARGTRGRQIDVGDGTARQRVAHGAADHPRLGHSGEHGGERRLRQEFRRVDPHSGRTRSPRHGVAGDDSAVLEPRRLVDGAGRQRLAAEPEQRAGQQRSTKTAAATTARMARPRPQSARARTPRTAPETAPVQSAAASAPPRAAFAPDAPGWPPSRPRYSGRDAATPRIPPAPPNKVLPLRRLRIEQDRDRQLEHRLHLVRRGPELHARRHQPKHRRDPVAGARHVIGQPADQFHARGSSAISSAASRKAAASGLASPGSIRPPGKLT